MATRRAALIPPPVFASLVAALAFAAMPTAAQRADAGMRVGITLAAATSTSAAFAAAPPLPIPAGVTRVATVGPSHFDVATMTPGMAMGVYRAALSGLGYLQTAESSSDRSWASRWRHGDDSCVAIRVQPVVGTAQVRIVASAVACDGG